jgi:hypothetical protein
MLIKGVRRLIFALTFVLLGAVSLLVWHTRIRFSHPQPSRQPDENAFGRSPENESLGVQQSGPSITITPEDSGSPETHNEIFSPSHKDKKYFAIDFEGEKAMNPSIIPHPELEDTWIVVAQQGRSDSHPKSSWFAELVCDARFVQDRLECIKPPKILPIAATSGDKCVDDLAYFAFNIGPHDARMFYGPESPYAIYGSNSGYTCFGQWMQDFRMLVDWSSPEAIDAGNPYRLGTEIQRSTPWGPVEKNWFVFWDSEGQMYAHYDIFPQRVFASLGRDGSAGMDLAPLAAMNDEKCMAKYMPSVAPRLESIHQATNSLSITLCQRSDPFCQVDDSNTFILTIFQHKSYYSFHSVYEPYAMLFRRMAPFEIFGISSKPIWIHGRKRAGEAPKPRGAAFEGVVDWNQTEMFYVTSMSWKAQGQTYHGYLDDVLFVGFGIEDERTAAIDVVAEDLLRDLGLCSMA